MKRLFLYFASARWRQLVALLAALFAAPLGAVMVPAHATDLAQLSAAFKVDVPSHRQYLGAARAGKRLVVVGERGAIALSDDDGKSFRQARSVPVQASLTAVTFVDAQCGYAVGHWGIILRTDDAGETWQVQRSEVQQDRPLFSVYFRNARQGWAVGLWSVMLATEDGGKTWLSIDLAARMGVAKMDGNLYAIFGDAAGHLYASAEQGAVLRSDDAGAHWNLVHTGYAGSLWSGAALRSGALLVAGLRGSVYRSTDLGKAWTRVMLATRASITSIAQLRNGHVVATALDGSLLESADDGLSFKASEEPRQSALNAALESAAGSVILLSNRGVIGAAERTQ